MKSRLHGRELIVGQQKILLIAAKVVAIEKPWPRQIQDRGNPIVQKMPEENGASATSLRGSQRVYEVFVLS
jgi:hypothetical protein